MEQFSPNLWATLPIHSIFIPIYVFRSRVEPMHYKLPNLTNTCFSKFSTTFTLFDESIASHEGSDDLGDAFADLLCTMEDVYRVSRVNDETWVSAEISEQGFNPFLDLNISVHPIASWTENLDKVARPFDVLLGDLSRFLSIRTPRLVISTANFSIPIEKLPADGFVKEAMAVRTSAGGERLSLNGAEWAFRGFPRDRIAWSYDVDAQVLFGSVVRATNQSVNHEDLLIDDYYIALSRLERIILEKRGT